MGVDEAYGIAVDGSGNAYVTGITYSTEATFPVLVGPDLTSNGGLDAFVAKVVLDVMPPTSSASSPTYASTAPITVTWSASDEASGVSSTTLWVKFGSSGAWVDTGLSQPGTSGNFAYSPANGDGTYYFATVATDNAGNVENDPTGSGDDSTIYDTTIPESSASTPTYATTAPITVTWSASDATSGVNLTTLWVKFGSGGMWVDTGLSQLGTSGNFTYSPTHGDGTYYFATVATDNAGNMEALPSNSGDASTIYDTAAPTSMASSPDFATTAPISITWTASDATSGVITTMLWVKVGDSDAWADSGLSQSGTSGTFYYNPSSGNNTYYFATVSTDYAGNVEVTPSGAGDDSTVYQFTFTVFLPVILNHSVSGNQAIR